MAILESGSPDMVALENLMDRVGLSNVIYAVAFVCREKADHLRSNWQDESAARAWERDANRIERITSKLECDVGA